jgi:hypothetical protein
LHAQQSSSLVTTEPVFGVYVITCPVLVFVFYEKTVDYEAPDPCGIGITRSQSQKSRFGGSKVPKTQELEVQPQDDEELGGPPDPELELAGGAIDELEAGGATDELEAGGAIDELEAGGATDELLAGGLTLPVITPPWRSLSYLT